MNLNLGSDAPTVFKALVEATAFGSRRIAERFEQEGVPIRGVIALGGVAKKSPFVMQTLADVMNVEIQVAASEQTCALGAAMFAATVGGVYEKVGDAIEAMGSGFDASYAPNKNRADVLYDKLYKKYLRFGEFIENETLG
jgi:L-ribulokinase